MLKFLDGSAGTIDGSFFLPPKWVDLSKPPGCTSLVPYCSQFPKWTPMLTGKNLLYSPNLVWLVIALLVYFAFPYDFSRAQTFQQDWILARLGLNCSIVLLYYGYWHVTLYWFHWSKRPFVSQRDYRWSKVGHNVFYTLLGTMQWTLWEVIMIHCYATGKIGFAQDSELIGSLQGSLKFVAGIILVPVYRDFHFFFAHRFLHNRFLYKYAHATHHRNTDVEPFAGMTMHPIEHLYYFSCVGPSLYLAGLSPFHFLWNGIHLLLSPAAPHSGWEDHWQSQAFHAIHHRYFECNYGVPGVPLDRWFGTFRETMGKSSSKYASPKQNYEDKNPQTIQGQTDNKATFLGLPTSDQIVYNTICCAGIPWLVYSALNVQESNDVANLVALAASMGPFFVGAMLLLATRSATQSKQTWKFIFFYPFHKDALWGKLGIGLLAGFLMAVMPVYHMVHTLLVDDPNETVYHFLWGY